MPFNVGENVGPYRIIEQLGQGGMATVFKAYHASLDRYVALKVLHPAFNEDTTFEARFQREARVVAKLEHPHIVPVYDYAEHEKRPYLVMKYIEGDTLKARLSEGPLSSEEIAKVVDTVGSALAYAHRHGVLHRDIKPSNVLVSKDGEMYLADFGLARIAQSGESTLSSDMIMGTPQYISPEQALGKNDLDARTDIYSFGVMLYEMVVGQVPFSADTPFSVIHDHIYTPLPLPRTVNSNVPEAVERVLLKSLAKDRADRHKDANAMIQAFKSAWQEAGVPMQGTFIKLAQPVATVPEAERSGESVEQPAMKEEPTKVAAKADAVVAAQEPKRKRSIWLLASLGLVFLMCLGLLAFARSNRLFASLRGTPNASTNAPIVSQPTQIVPPIETVVPSVAPPTEQNLPPQLLEAQQRASENSNDPRAQLDLALAYWDFKMQREAYETLVRMIKLAGKDNEALYMEAGDEFVGRDGWLPAASMYFQAVKAYGLGQEVPAELENAFHEAMYKASDRPDVLTMLPFDNIAQVDQPIALIARARNSFYSGRIDDAHTYLNQVKRLKPNMYEAFLLEAEFDATEGKPEQARLLAGSLTSDLSVPEWIRIYAEEIMKRLP
jgi:tRNA A-37 threonylcarbamoyl transferase component Bud32/tetratricopeptide (TPR) repeat protein